MKKICIIFFALLCGCYANAQKFFREKLPHAYFAGQFAGSTGLYSAGAALSSKGGKIDLGLMLGHLPRAFGGPVKTISLKFTYNPLSYTLGKQIGLEPIQAGAFLCQNFAPGLNLLWGNNYPKGYYWWNKSLRYHIFTAAQFFYAPNFNRIKKINVYLETNTNDLYLYSYFSNMKSLRLGDIFFLAAGIKVFVK